MGCFSTTNENKKTASKKLEARREYYRRNLDKERMSACERARRRRAAETKQEAEDRKAQHCVATARYRAQNRSVLKMASWQRRKRIKHQKLRERDEAELEALMAEYPDAEDEGNTQ